MLYMVSFAIENVLRNDYQTRRKSILSKFKLYKRSRIQRKKSRHQSNELKIA